MRGERQPKTGYADTKVTKAPNWHGLVAWDLLLNNLTTGLFLVAALGELVDPSAFSPLGKAAYPIALALLLADLACLVFDLGNPLKFHHMLRVFKPTSPMSLGTWCLTAYSLPLTVLAAVDFAIAVHLLPEGSTMLGVVHSACLIGGLIPALGSAVYKGVLFSTSSQPAWRDARWLGGYLVNSAFMLGAAELLAIALLMGQARAATLLRPALVILLVIHVIPLTLLIAEFRDGLERTHTRDQRIQVGVLAIGLGLVVPLVLTLAASGPLATMLALASLLAGGLAIRWTIVMIPHSIH
jgi:Polysulphide reductase, NrfD